MVIVKGLMSSTGRTRSHLLSFWFGSCSLHGWQSVEGSAPRRAAQGKVAGRQEGRSGREELGREVNPSRPHPRDGPWSRNHSFTTVRPFLPDSSPLPIRPRLLKTNQAFWPKVQSSSKSPEGISRSKQTPAHTSTCICTHPMTLTLSHTHSCMHGLGQC